MSGTRCTLIFNDMQLLTPATELRRALEAYFVTADEAVASAYLFGSFAQGRSHAESDVDVRVLLDRTQVPLRGERPELRLRLTSDLMVHLSRNEVDVIVLNDVTPELGRAVIRDGIRVFCRDHALDHPFVRDVQLLAADFDIFLRRARRRKLEVLRS